MAAERVPLVCDDDVITSGLQRILVDGHMQVLLLISARASALLKRDVMSGADRDRLHELQAQCTKYMSQCAELSRQRDMSGESTLRAVTNIGEQLIEMERQMSEIDKRYQP